MVYSTMELIINEGRVYGAKYYTVLPQVPEMYHQIQQTWLDMEKWMTETFGPQPENGVFTPGARWYANDSRFWFRNKEDLEWFILRWQ